MTTIPAFPTTARYGRNQKPLSWRAQQRITYDKLTRHGWYHWAYYVVPTKLFRDFLLDKFHGREDGWREQLYFDMAHSLKLEQKAIARRMRDVWITHSQVTKAAYADAACLALGLDLDRDTNIPQLPGTVKLTRELIEIRADKELDELSLQRYVHQVQRICALILGYPHNTERLLDLAPFDCLRPY